MAVTLVGNVCDMHCTQWLDWPRRSHNKTLDFFSLSIWKAVKAYYDEGRKGGINRHIRPYGFIPIKTVLKSQLNLAAKKHPKKTT